MILANDLFTESFRALSPEKLGSAVLELCRDRGDRRDAGAAADERVAGPAAGAEGRR